MYEFSFVIIFLPPFILFAVFLRKWAHNAPPTVRKNLPPSPPGLPVLGHLHKIGTLPHRSLQQLSARYGPLMLIHLGNRPALIVSSADGAREVLKTHDKSFSSRPKMRIPEEYIYGSKDIGFAPYGEHLRQVRSISVLHLLSNKRVQSFSHVRDEEISLVIKNIAKQASSTNPVTNMSRTFEYLTNDIICRVALGRKYDDDGGVVKKILNEFVELVGAFDVGDYIPGLGWINHFTGFKAKADRVGKYSDNFMESIVEEHRKRRGGKGEDTDEAGRQDLVDVLLDLQSQNKDAKAPIDNDVIKALILDMFAAGTHTTFATLEWIMSELMRNDDVMEKLCNEVRAVGHDKTEITENDLEKMHYLKAVIKEGLRLHPAVPLLIPHESIEECNIKGYDIAAGTQLFVNVWAIGRDPFLWENPEEFKPERFLGSNIDYKGMNFEFLPFGSGRRGCPGISFGVAIVELTLARLIHKFNFALPDGRKGRDLDISEASGLTVHKKFPLLVVATPC